MWNLITKQEDLTNKEAVELIRGLMTMLNTKSSFYIEDFYENCLKNVHLMNNLVMIAILRTTFCISKLPEYKHDYQELLKACHNKATFDRGQEYSDQIFKGLWA